MNFIIFTAAMTVVILLFAGITWLLWGKNDKK